MDHPSSHLGPVPRDLGKCREAPQRKGGLARAYDQDHDPPTRPKGCPRLQEGRQTLPLLAEGQPEDVPAASESIVLEARVWRGRSARDPPYRRGSEALARRN